MSEKGTDAEVRVRIWPTLLVGGILALFLCVGVSMMLIGGFQIWPRPPIDQPIKQVVNNEEPMFGTAPVIVYSTQIPSTPTDVQESIPYTFILEVIPIPEGAEDLHVSAGNSVIEYKIRLTTIELFDFYLGSLVENGWSAVPTIQPENSRAYGLMIATYQGGGEIRLQIDDFGVEVSKVVITITKPINN